MEEATSPESPLAALTILAILSTVIPVVLYSFLNHKWSAHALFVCSFTAFIGFYVLNGLACTLGETLRGCDVCIPKPMWASFLTTVCLVASARRVGMGPTGHEDLEKSNFLREAFRLPARLTFCAIWLLIVQGTMNLVQLLGMDTSFSVYNIVWTLIIGTMFITAIIATYSPLLEVITTVIYQFIMHRVPWSRLYDFIVLHSWGRLQEKLFRRGSRRTPLQPSPRVAEKIEFDECAISEGDQQDEASIADASCTSEDESVSEPREDQGITGSALGVSCHAR